MQPYKITESKQLNAVKLWLMTTVGQLFIYLVVAPSVLTGIYLYLLSPDRYVSTAHLSIYDSSSSPVSNDLFSSLGLASGQSNNDLQLLRSYLESPKILQLADKALSIKEHYSASQDFVFGITEDSAFEDFHKFFLKQAYAVTDPETGLLQITTEAYSPEFSLTLNSFLVAEGERFINQLNQDVARSEMTFAEAEIARSLKILHAEQDALTQFQSTKNIASPDSAGESIIGITYGMETLLAEAKTELSATLTYLSEDSPQAKSLSAKIAALEKQIEEQRSRVISSADGGEALNRLGVEYSDLLFKVELARVVYETAVSSYELSRNQASKKLKHLLVASAPVLAEKPALPDRSYWLLSMTLIYLALFAIVRMTVRSIHEHRD